MSTDQILTTYLIFHALFDGGVFEISYKSLHDLHGLFSQLIFFYFSSISTFLFFVFHKKSFKFVGQKIDDVTEKRGTRKKERKRLCSGQLELKTQKALFDLSHMKALITDFKNTTIEKSMKNQVSGQKLVCRHEGLRFDPFASTVTEGFINVELS